jgi:hypothetical protein
MRALFKPRFNVFDLIVLATIYFAAGATQQWGWFLFAFPCGILSGFAQRALWGK